jgi:hypothetical protein
MSKKSSSKSGYRSPTRSEKILAFIGLVVIISMLLSALALGDQTLPVQPTSPPITLFFPTDTVALPTATVTASGPAAPTPGVAPAPGSP